MTTDLSFPWAPGTLPKIGPAYGGAWSSRQCRDIGPYRSLQTLWMIFTKLDRSIDAATGLIKVGDVLYEYVIDSFGKYPKNLVGGYNYDMHPLYFNRDEWVHLRKDDLTEIRECSRGWTGRIYSDELAGTEVVVVHKPGWQTRFIDRVFYMYGMEPHRLSCSGLHNLLNCFVAAGLGPVEIRDIMTTKAWTESIKLDDDALRLTDEIGSRVLAVLCQFRGVPNTVETHVRMQTALHDELFDLMGCGKSLLRNVVILGEKPAE